MKDQLKKKIPEISVIIPLYNHEAYIREAVFSVLNQTVQDFELIIINDGSTDGSEEVVKKIQDPRIRYFYQENHGAHHTINRGIQMSCGRFICILNSDDVFEKIRFEACLSAFEEDNTLDAVFTWLEWIDENGAHIRYLNGAEDNWENHQPETSFKDGENIALDLLAGNFLSTTSNLFCRRSVFDHMEGFRNFRYVHDYDFFLRLCLKCNVRIFPSPLLKYRIHSANTINENKPETFFEIGVMFSDVLIHQEMGQMVSDGKDFHGLTRFFNSVNPWFTERIMVCLLLHHIWHSHEKGALEALTENVHHPFRKACVDHIRSQFDVWKNQQPLHEQIRHLEQVAAEQEKTIHALQYDLQKKEELVELYRHSVSLKIGRTITGPVKKAFSMGKNAMSRFFSNEANSHVPDGNLKGDAFSEKCSAAFTAVSERYGSDVSHVFIVPWLVQGGSDLETLNYINVLSNHFLASKIVVIATENRPSPWKERLPDGVTFIPWGEQYCHLLPEEQEEVLNRLIACKKTHAVHIINSDLGYRVLVKNGNTLKKNSHLYACVFCTDTTEEGEDVGYSVWYIPKIYKYLDALMCDNRCHLDYLAKTYGLSDEKMFVNYHPADMKTKNSKIKKSKQDEKKLNILWAGRLDRQKRPDILIRVAEKCRKLPFVFHVHGAPVLEADHYTKKFEALENIIYHGGFDKGLSSIETDRFDCFLYTSQWDGLPNVLLEAMMAGLPVVSSHVGGIGELIFHKKTGYLVAPFDDEDGYVKCLLEIYENPDIIPEIVKNAFSLLRERHSWEAFTRAVADIPDYVLTT